MSNRTKRLELGQKAHGFAEQMLHYVESHYTRIPEKACTCGRPVVFSATNNYFTCIRCGKKYKLVVEVVQCE